MSPDIFIMFPVSGVPGLGFPCAAESLLGENHWDDLPIGYVPDLPERHPEQHGFSLIPSSPGT